MEPTYGLSLPGMRGYLAGGASEILHHSQRLNLEHNLKVSSEHDQKITPDQGLNMLLGFLELVDCVFLALLCFLRGKFGFACPERITVTTAILHAA